MEPRSVNAGRGWQWIVDGFTLFRKNSFMWIAITLVLALIGLVSASVPGLKWLLSLLFNLFTPVFFAGLMIGCKAIEEGEDLELVHLFAGFQTHAANLVTIGGVQLVGSLLAVFITVLVVSSSSVSAVVLTPNPDPSVLLAAIPSVLFGMLIGFAIYIPIIMLIWFAPLLVVFNSQTPMGAMKLSFRACWKNWIPFSIYGFAVFVLLVIAWIPFLLGLFVLVPVVFCSIYASYKDIFTAGSAPAPAGNPFLK
jgi:uncharacterized membrane protein